MVKRKYASIEELIKDYLATNRFGREEYQATQSLIDELAIVKQMGYFTKEEFVKKGMRKAHDQRSEWLWPYWTLIPNISKQILQTGLFRDCG